MRIGIIGFGSIGRRHARALRAIGVEDVVALRTRRGVLQDKPPDLAFVEELAYPDALERESFDAFIVANPSSLHGETVRTLLPLERPMLVEKPLVADRGELPEMTERERARILVGFPMRFHSLIRSITRSLRDGAIGEPIAGRLTFRSHLPDWHPYADYRVEYMGRKDLGGGIARTACHEIDLVQYWFGRVSAVSGVVARLSELEVTADDVAHFVCRTANASVIVELDFCSPRYRREGSIVGTEGAIEYDFARATAVRHVRGTTESLELSQGGDPAELVDRMYEDQLRDFLRFVQSGESENASVIEGLHVASIVECAERASLVSVD